MKCLVCENEINDTLKVCPYCENDFVGNGLVLTEAAKRLIAQRKEAWENKQKVIHEEPKETLLTSDSPEVFVYDDYYKLPWGSNHPGHIVYLIDLSGSMAYQGKFEIIKEVIQKVSNLVVSMCKESVRIRENGESVNRKIVKNRVSVTILGYNSKIIKLFEGTAIELNDKLKEAKIMESTTQKFPLYETFPNKVNPTSMTYTEMAFKAALNDIKQWIAHQEQEGKPIPAPVVIHITDGHPEEKDVEESVSIRNALQVAKEIQNVEVNDGKALLFNIHFDGNPQTKPLRFPTQAPNDERRRFLYEASSPLPPKFCQSARAIGLDASDNCRFMISNENEKDLLVRLIEFGSSVSSFGNSNAPTPKYD